MNQVNSSNGPGTASLTAACWLRRATLVAVLATTLAGCGLNSYADPSKTGRFHETPTTLPILDRIDVIETSPSRFRETTSVTREDLLPNDLTYRITPGDVLTVQAFELEFPGEVSTRTRRVDPAGNFRLPVVGDIPAAGLTVQEFQDAIVDRLREEQAFPQVSVQLEEGGHFQYTIYGNVPGTGVYRLQRPDFRLLDALSNAGGAPQTTRRIYVIREVTLDEGVMAPYERDRGPDEPRPGMDPEVNIEDLIDQLDEDEPSPGMFSQDRGATIDVDDLEPVRMAQDADDPMEDVDMPAQPGRGQRGTADDGTTFIFIEERGQWVRVRTDDLAQGEITPVDESASGDAVLERIIEIPYDQLIRGERRLDIVVRPGDKIFVDFPPIGLVYIEGEVNRPGVFNIPQRGEYTLSRAIATAGGLGSLAIPSRVDITRIVGENREATIRVNLAAIRQRTEPDIYLRPDDHIIVGTSFAATPLAVIRNGFRMTYGFGFLLDRNFGNDVFGAPPAQRFVN